MICVSQILRFRSSNVDDVESIWQRFVPSARLQGVDRQRFGFDWTSATVPGLDVVSYDLTAKAHSSVDLEGQIMACRLASRGAQVASRGRALHADSPWIAADDPAEARWDGTARVRAFVLDRDFAQASARQLAGDDSLVLRFHDASPTSVVAGRQWETGYRYLMTCLTGHSDDGVDIDPLIAAELRRHALMLTLTAFPSTYADVADRAPQTRAAPVTVRRALTYIDEHAASPITIDDVARAVGISTRGLQYAFRRAMDVTPTEHLRRVRLAGAHEDLRRGAGSVASIGRRWGFADASRFARYYREEYGVSPRDTARSETRVRIAPSATA